MDTKQSLGTFSGFSLVYFDGEKKKIVDKCLVAISASICVPKKEEEKKQRKGNEETKRK